MSLPPLPPIGSTWKHKNGNQYRVIAHTNIVSSQQDRYPTTVVYENIQNKAKYSRRLKDWHGSMSLEQNAVAEKISVSDLNLPPKGTSINEFIINKAREYFPNDDATVREMVVSLAQTAVCMVVTDKVTLINNLSKMCHGAAAEAGWWNDLHTGESLIGKRNIGELCMLMVTELSEGFEASRKNANDDHLPHRKGVEVEMADCLIRIFDFAGAMELDLGGALIEKMKYNSTRADHKKENRLKDDGKKC